MSPPTAVAASGPNLRENGERQDQFLSPRILMREGAKCADDMGLAIRGPRLRLIVQRFIDTGRADVDFRTWFISYADPTGETAVKNVMAGGGANV